MSARPLLLVDRDGTLLEEPADRQIDDYAKMRFVPGAIPALLRLRDAGYRMVMVSTQDGLGTDRYPQAAFAGPPALLLQLLESPRCAIEAGPVDRSLPQATHPPRKHGHGLVQNQLRAP